MFELVHIPGVEIRDYSQIFNELDINNDGFLSFNEFSLYLEGAKMDKLQRLNELDPSLVSDI